MLENEVKKRALAAGDDNWEKNLNEMIRVAEERSINRKSTSITKGINGGALDRIKVATHDWFHSVQVRELYHYEAGNFEAYPQKGDNKFYSHQFPKPLPADARQVPVRKDSEGYWYVEDSLEWYYPQAQDRLYRRHTGEGETFAMNRDGEYSVTKPSTIPRDATAALVTKGQAHGTHEIKKLSEVPIDIWREETNQR